MSPLIRLCLLLILPTLTASAAPPRRARTAAPATSAAVRQEALRLLAIGKTITVKKYPQAAAVVLLDKFDVIVRRDGTTQETFRYVSKVLDSRGRDSESNISQSYDLTRERLRVTHARTIHPDGRVVNVRPEDIFERDRNGSDMVDSTREIQFTFAGVEPGCIIDYQTVLQVRKPLLPGHAADTFTFEQPAETRPELVWQHTLRAEPGVKIRTSLRDPLKILRIRTDKKPNGAVVYTYTAANVAPLPSEPMSDTTPLIPRLEYTTIPDWDTVARWDWSLIRDRITADAGLGRITDTVTAGKTTPEARARAIFQYVQDKVRYYAMEVGMGGYQPRMPTKTLAKRAGDCKDMAVLLMAMLRHAGIRADYVSLNTDMDGEKMSTLLPDADSFDHAICVAEIDGKKYWLDATAQYAPWGANLHGNTEVFVERDGRGTWVWIPDDAAGEYDARQKIAVTLEPSGDAKGKIAVEADGITAMGMRPAHAVVIEEQRKKMAQGLAKNIVADAVVTSYSINIPADPNAPASITANADFPAWATRTGDLLLFKGRAEQKRMTFVNNLPDEKRKLPIVSNSTPTRSVRELTVRIPKDTVVLSRPEDIVIDSPMTFYKRTVTLKDDVLQIRHEMNSKRANIPAGRYAEVRKLLLNIQKAEEELVVLKLPHPTPPGTAGGGTP